MRMALVVKELLAEDLGEIGYSRLSCPRGQQGFLSMLIQIGRGPSDALFSYCSQSANL